jgi:hypothetical protein
MSDYAALSQEDTGLLARLRRMFCPTVPEDPYSTALADLNREYGRLLSDVRAQDAKLVLLYTQFYAQMQTHRTPDVDRFVASYKWYKRNRDEMHTALLKVLETRALAHENPSKFMQVWEHMPEAIRQSRRKWRQPYTEQPAIERDVDAAFEMPPKRAQDVPLDYETEFDADE